MKNNLTGQICTLNLPMFCNTKEKRRILKMITDAYLKTEEVAANRADFEYIERNETEAIYLSVGDNKTIIMISSANLNNKELMVAKDKIRKKMEVDEALFFISKY